MSPRADASAGGCESSRFPCENRNNASHHGSALAHQRRRPWQRAMARSKQHQSRNKAKVAFSSVILQRLGDLGRGRREFEEPIVRNISGPLQTFTPKGKGLKLPFRLRQERVESGRRA